MLLYKLVFFKSSRNQLPSEFLFPFIFKKFILLIFGCAGSSLLCWLFSGGGEQGLLSSCSTQAFHCGGFSLQRISSGVRGLSRCGSQTLEHGLSSCGAVGF